MTGTTRKHPPLKDLLNAVWGAFIGLFFAGIAVAAARKDVDSLSWKEWMALAVFAVVGLVMFGAGVRGSYRLYHPPSRTVRKREKRIGRTIGLWVAYAAALAMVVGSAIGLLSGFVLPLLRTGTFHSGPLIALPIGAFGASILLFLPDVMPERKCRRRLNVASVDKARPLLAMSGRRRAAALACLTAFPLGVGLLMLGALVVEGFPRNGIPAAIGGTAFLAFGLFLARWAVPSILRNGRHPFIRFHAPPGAVMPGQEIPVQCDIEPTVLKGATRLLIRPFVAILSMDETTPPPLERTPEGRRPDDAAAWYGEPLLDISDPGAMAHASFSLALPDFRKFSQKHGFNPWDDSVEWRLEVLLFRGRVPRRAVFRIQIAEPAWNRESRNPLP